MSRVARMEPASFSGVILMECSRGVAKMALSWSPGNRFSSASMTRRALPSSTPPLTERFFNSAVLLAAWPAISASQDSNKTSRSETTWVCQGRELKEAMGVFIMGSVWGLFIDHLYVRTVSGRDCDDLLRCVLPVGLGGIGPARDAVIVWRRDLAARGKRCRSAERSVG